jgi:hypothetical protein
MCLGIIGDEPVDKPETDFTRSLEKFDDFAEVIAA